MEMFHRLNCNSDGSVIEIVEHDPKGNKLNCIRGTGKSATTTPAKAQGRALYGFVEAYRATGDDRWLLAAKRCGEYSLKALEVNGIPNYDLKDANHILPDSSAGALIAHAFLNLYKETDEERWNEGANKLLRGLVSTCLSQDEMFPGILEKGILNVNLDQPTCQSHIHGDFHFIEAIKKISH
jgi:unsaturated chondroitin disaccharide hydrolase